MQLDRQCLLSGCQLARAGQLAASAQVMLDQAVKEKRETMSGALWCDLGEHAFSSRDRKRTTYKISTFDEETGAPVEDDRVACGQHAIALKAQAGLVGVLRAAGGAGRVPRVAGWPAPGPARCGAGGRRVNARTWVGENDQEGTEALLMGHSVTVAGDALLRLDDGTELEIIPNDGGCSCGSGDYSLTALNGIENIITRVEVVDEEAGYDEHSYKIFVYAGNERVNLLTVDGNDGNGYYGTGYEIRVKR